MYNDAEIEELKKLVPWDENEPSPTYQKLLGGISNVEKEKKAGEESIALISRFADIQSESISWLWPGRIALGKLTLIVGDPGIGKSLLTATLAATVSQGRLWPVDNTVAPVGDVIFLSAEDDAADTIKPRLEAANADCQRVYTIQAIADGKGTERTFSLKRDIPALEKLLSQLSDCRLLIVDPISAYLDGTDSHNNADVRGLVAPLSALAARHKVAIVAISHLNKSSSGNALYRAIGSVAFVASARAAYVVARDKDNSARRLLLPSKNNLAPDTTGLAYSVSTAQNGAPVIAWETTAVEITADEALALPESNEERTDTDWAVSFLQDQLSAGPMPAAKISKEARSASITDKPLRRARDRLGIKPKKSAFTGGWVWALPTLEDAHTDQDAIPKKEGVLDDQGHLGN